MHISEFDYELPEELIAQHPLPQRDASRMLVVNRSTKSWHDSQFASLSDYLRSGDVLAINNTRVFPARLLGRREASEGRVEILLVRELRPQLWEALLRPGNRLKEGDVVIFPETSLRAVVVDPPGNEMRRVEFDSVAKLRELMETRGKMPLPPYIKRPDGSEDADRERYQTVFARERGAIAAPTAGLHFTPQILDHLQQLDVSVVEITLHVGYGTFEPVRADEIEKHQVRPEVFEVTTQSAETINAAKRKRHRVVAVGTTTTRALETTADDNGCVSPASGTAGLTILPGHKFRIVDGLLTNFHLPQSSLLLLVCAFAGRELILSAYRHAVAQRYRFYSYGDCMLII